MEKTLIISLNSSHIFFNHRECIPRSQSNLPGVALTFKTEEIFWQIELLAFYKETGILKVKVLDYNVVHPAAMYLQLNSKYLIKDLVFEKLDWHELQPLTYKYDLDMLRPYLVHAPPSFRMERPVKKPIVTPSTTPPPPSPPRAATVAQPVKKKFHVEEKVEFKDLRFADGLVAFDIQPFHTTYTVELKNDFLQESFNFCKEWFIKKFKKSWVQVSVTGYLIDEKLGDYTVTSENLSSINDTMILAIREAVLKDFVRKAMAKQTGKRVHGVADIQDQSALKDLRTRTSHLTEKELEILMTTILARNARNEKQIDFLAKHPSVQMSHFKFTRPPRKGLIFGFEGGMFTHFVWELLQSNATYVWSFPTNKHTPNEMHEFLEQYIALITDEGRFEWRKSASFQLQENHLFTPVNHIHQNTHLNEGLPLWIDTIESIICR